MSDEVMADDEPGSERRKAKNFLQKPQFQLKYTNWYITGAFIIMATTVTMIHYRLKQIDGLLNAEETMGMGGHVPIYDAFTDITTFALAGFVIFVIYACSLAIVINHRIAGPSIALVACIEQMRNGNYDYNRDLRKNDELQHIHDALRDLNSSLRRHATDPNSEQQPS